MTQSNSTSQGVSAVAGPLKLEAARPLSGVIHAPGDKSISHRALLLAALASGESRITGLLEAEDVLRTAASLRALGAAVTKDGIGETAVWRVKGGAWTAPARPLYFGNSGTGVRLAMGAVAGAGVEASFDGDISLRSRPMGRILEPLRLLGVNAVSQDGRLPVRVASGNPLTAVTVRMARASAQVKSAILLAALGAKGKTRIHEPVLCRDHTERMLGAFGVALSVTPDGEGGRFIDMEGGQRLSATDINVPGDPSSAAFPIAAALITPNSDVTVAGVLMNPLRTGFYETLREMGADISFENEREVNGEKIADIRARHSVLSGVDVPAARAPSMIDEYPILAIVAAFAQGETKMRGLEELRVKESDRIAAVEAGLVACGGDVASGSDWMSVQGDGGLAGDAKIKTAHDHRIAMSFLIAGCASERPIEVDDVSMIATSFPAFLDSMTHLGAERRET